MFCIWQVSLFSRSDFLDSIIVLSSSNLKVRSIMMFSKSYAFFGLILSINVLILLLSSGPNFFLSGLSHDLVDNASQR